MSDELRVDIWHWYSIDQAWAAVLFSRMCGQLEQSPPPASPDEANRGLSYAEEAAPRHRALVTGSIFASVAFLEACINELFASARYPNLEVGGKLPLEERERMVSMGDYLETLPTLERFQAALTLLRRTVFDKGRSPYQDAALLVKLRNALVHYKPRWRPGGSEAFTSAEESKLTKALAEKKFAPHPFTGPGNPFFPDQCLGHACTAWAWQSALSFSDEFFARVGVPPPYAHLRSELDSGSSAAGLDQES
jgi:hypothetical protein